jgi:hypothetical protein
MLMANAGLAANTGMSVNGSAALAEGSPTVKLSPSASDVRYDKRRRKRRRHYVKPHGHWAAGEGQGEGECGVKKHRCPPPRRYRGTNNQVDPKTKRNVKITFVVKDGVVIRVRTLTIDRCRHGGPLRVIQRKFWPSGLFRKKGHKHFQFTVHAGPKKQPATLRGTRRGRAFTGKLTDISPDPSGHGVCRASARWRATRL